MIMIHDVCPIIWLWMGLPLTVINSCSWKLHCSVHSPFMSGSDRSDAKCFPAISTGERLLSSVIPFMLFTVMSSRKGAFTILAFVWFLSCVYSPMREQCIRQPEHLITIFTLKGFFSRVCSSVSNQCLFASEAATTVHT